MSFQELETGEQTDELSEGYNDYLASLDDSDRPEYVEPMTFREWLNLQDEPDFEVREDEGGGVYVE